MIPPPSLSLTSLKSTLIYHLIIPLVILFPALVLQPQPYFPAPKFLIHSEPSLHPTSSPTPTPSPPPDHTLILGQSWHIDLFCASQPASTCQLTRTALERAATRLASVVRFRAPVAARVNVAAGTPRGTLGWARPVGNGVPVRHADDGLVYMYPRALVKQLPDLEGVGEWIKGGVGEAWDVEVQVNAGEEWWVEGAGLGDIQSHQYDLEYLLVHELMHALGFGHDQVLHHAAPLPARLSPAFDSHPQVDPRTPSFTRFSHPSIWNRFTLLNLVPVVTYKQVLDQAVSELIAKGDLRPANTAGNHAAAWFRPADVYLALAGHARGSRAMRDMYDLATRNGSLVFDTGAWPAPTNGVKVELETGLDPFDAASSVGHLHVGAGGKNATQDQEQDGLMGWQLRRGVKVDTVGIGPRTRSVLGALGYTLAGQEWVARRGVASVDVGEVQRMQQEAAGAQSASGGVRDAVAWIGAVGVVGAWVVHRGWV